MDLDTLGQQLRTPLGFFSLLNLIVWSACAYRAWRYRYAPARLQGYIWFVFYSLNLSAAYLTGVDRDLLRVLLVAPLIGWALIIGTQLFFEMKGSQDETVEEKRLKRRLEAERIALAAVVERDTRIRDEQDLVHAQEDRDHDEEGSPRSPQDGNS